MEKGPLPTRIFEHFAAFQKGDTVAFELFYKAAYPVVYRRVIRLCDRQQAEDITQKTFVLVYLKGSKATFLNSGKLLAWIYTIATHEVYKYWRERKPALLSEKGVEMLELKSDANSIEPLDELQDKHVKDILETCIASLAEAAKLYLLTPLSQGLTFRESAKLCGLSLGQFKHRYEKALQTVKACMKSKGYEDM